MSVPDMFTNFLVDTNTKKIYMKHNRYKQYLLHFGGVKARRARR
jgi:hypothetical protein